MGNNCLKFVIKALRSSKVIVAFVIIAPFIISTVFAATSPWSQTDWSAGITTGTVTSTVDTYESDSNISVSSSGLIKISTSPSWHENYSDWKYQKKITFNNTDATLGITTENLTNIPVLIKLDTGVNIDYAKVKASGEDLRFSDSDGTALSYEIETWNPSGTSYIWVKVPQIDQNSNTDYIYMYYGNSSAEDAQNVSDVWSNGYVMVQHLKDATATSVVDSTTSGYTGNKRTTNAPLQIDGKIGKAQNFGTSDYIDLGNILNVGTADWTVEVWFRRATVGAGNGNILYNKENLYETAAGGGVVTYAWQPHWSWDGGSTATVGLNTWQKSTVVYDHAKQYMYKNGSQVYNRVQTGNIGTNTARLQIGARGDTAHSSFFVGDIDEMRVSNVVRNAAWLAASYASDNDTLNTYGSEVERYVSSGYLISNIFDSGFASDWGVLTYTTSGSGSVSVKIRSDSSSDMSGATDWGSCDAIASGAATTSSNCITDTDQYFQYRVYLYSSAGDSPSFEDIQVAFSASDQTSPPVNATDVALDNATDGAWTSVEPTISWTAGVDDLTGSGVIGNCISLDEADIGASDILNPASAAGKLTGIDDGVDLAVCPYIALGESLDLSQISGLVLDSGKQYYVSVKAVDATGNVWTGASEDYQDLVSFIYDGTSPTNPAFISMPGDFVSSKDITITWPTSAPDGPADEHSGLAGLQYRIGLNGTWYGANHSGTQDSTDLLPNSGSYTMDETYDYDALLEGSNIIYFRTWDLVDRVTTSYVSGALKINTIAPSTPQNLTVTPSDNTTNLYSFEWDTPVTYTGQVGNITYCYTVNTTPSASSCNWTSVGATSLGADAFATQPDTNTFYLVARDEANNVNYDTYAWTTFSYSGSAPGIPSNLDIADISIKATSNWKLAVSWEAPTDTGAGISTYKIYRSTSDTTCSASFSSFSYIGSTAGTSYTDTGLAQTTYYYCLKGCDSANNCSASSSTVSAYPDGKFVEAAELTSDPTVTNITTKKATVSWATDRDSDSKLAYGKKSKDYFDEEPSKSTQETDHSIVLTNLSPGTKYYYVAKWTDEDGNTGQSSEETFNTEPAPTIKDLKISGVSLDTATLNFTVKGASKVQVVYGESTSFGGIQEINTSSVESKQTVILTGLKDSTKYYFKIVPIDAEGDEYDNQINDFTTLPRPRISNVRFQQVRGTAQPTVLVTWNTNTEISSIVTIYPTANPELVRNEVNVQLQRDLHKMVIGGLSTTTSYSMVVKGVDRIGNEAISDVQTFTTSTDTRPPMISNIKVEGSIVSTDGGTEQEKQAQLIVTWDSDEASTSQIEYGEGSGATYSQRTQEDTNLTFNHVVVITNLSSSKVYHLRTISKDIAGNEAYSIDTVTITPKATDNALDLVVSSLSQIFGFISNLN